jgi:hypothetical protein
MSGTSWKRRCLSAMGRAAPSPPNPRAENMPPPPRPRRSADAIAVLHPLVREVLQGADEGEHLCAMFELEEAENSWIQVTGDQINMAYPFDDDPTARVVAAGVSGLERLSLASWEPRTHATFDYDPTASSLEVAALLDQLFLHVLDVPLVENEDYPLATEIFPLSKEAEQPS